jgi:hypothetical protein
VEIRFLRVDYIKIPKGLFRKHSWYFRVITLYNLIITQQQLSRGKYHWIFLIGFVIMWRIWSPARINWVIIIWRNLPRTPNFISNLFSFWLRDITRRSLTTEQGYTYRLVFWKQTQNRRKIVYLNSWK